MRITAKRISGRIDSVSFEILLTSIIRSVLFTEFIHGTYIMANITKTRTFLSETVKFVKLI